MHDEVFIVLFRGVGGPTQLPTKRLTEVLTEAGFRRVTTYIATGNVVLASALDPDEVKAEVAAIVQAEFGFTKALMVLTQAQWSALVSQNPFPEGADAPKTLHAFALETRPSDAAVAALVARAAATERLAVIGKVLYFHAPDGFGTSKLPPVIDRTLGVATTARNWNTVLKLEALAREVAASQ